MSKYHKLAWDNESKENARKEIYKRKPWLKSTGPKTQKGKQISKMNALKNDYELHNLMQELNELFKKQKEIRSFMNS